MNVRRAALLVVLIAGAAAPAMLMRSGAMPRGVPGEWEWPLVAASANPLDVLLASLGILAFAAFAALGMRSLAGSPSRVRQAVWVAALVVASVGAQLAANAGAPAGYGLTKWITLAIPGSSGYFRVAAEQAGDPMRFWADYPSWIARQDALHVGTHPPGLFLASRALLDLTRSNPGLARAINSRLPASVSGGFREVVGGLDPPGRAAVALMAMLAMALCAATVAPLYVLARSALPASSAWAAAALWPLAPSAVMFGPAADTAFPFLATLALASASRHGGASAFACGAALAIGMQLTLAFLAVGLVAAVLMAWRPVADWRRSAARIAATGAGFLAVTAAFWVVSGANPLPIWASNAANHARFYREYPRSYWPWVVANPIELAVGIGVPSALLVVAGLAGRPATRASWATLGVLAILTLGGRNLSEVGRLWLPFLPALLVAAGSGASRVGAGPGMLGAAVAAVGLGTIALESTIQVVYPF